MGGMTAECPDAYGRRRLRLRRSRWRSVVPKHVRGFRRFHLCNAWADAGSEPRTGGTRDRRERRHAAALGPRRQARDGRATRATGAACRGARSSASRAGRARHAVGDRLSARNRFPGVVVSVEVDGVMALVEIEAGPHRITAAITRDAVRGARARRGRAGDGDREGDVGDDREGRRDEGSGTLLAALTLALAAAACGGDDERVGSRQRRSPPLTVSAAASLKARVHELRPRRSRMRRREVLVRRLRRARRADRAGRQARRLRRGQHEAARRSSTPRASSRSRRSSPATSSCSPCRPTDAKVASLEDLERDGVTLAIGSKDVPVGSYTRTVLDKLPAAQRQAILRQRALRGARRRRDHRQADPGRGRRRLRVRLGRPRDRRQARRRSSCRATYSRRSPTASRWSKGAKHPAQARAFIAGLLDGAGAQALEDAGFDAAARAVRRAGWFGALLVAALTATLLFLTLPIVAIFVDAGPSDLLGRASATRARSRRCASASSAARSRSPSSSWSARRRPTCWRRGASAGGRPSSRSSSCRSCCRPRSPGSGCSRRSAPTASSAGSSRTPASSSC